MILASVLPDEKIFRLTLDIWYDEVCAAASGEAAHYIV